MFIEAVLQKRVGRNPYRFSVLSEDGLALLINRFGICPFLGAAHLMDYLSYHAAQGFILTAF